MEVLQKIGFIITQPKHFNMYSNIIRHLSDDDYEYVLNDFRKEAFPRVHQSAVDKKISFRIASDILRNRKRIQYKVVVGGGDSLGGTERLQLGWPFNTGNTHNLSGKQTGRNGWPSWQHMWSRIIAGKNPLKISMPLSSDIGRIRVYSESHMDHMNENTPGYPACIVYDFYFCVTNYHKSVIERNTGKPALVVGYTRYEEPPEKSGSLRAFLTEFGLDPSRKLIIWIPSSGSTRYIASAHQAIGALLPEFNILLRPHPDSWNQNRPEPEKALWEKLASLGFFIDKVEHRNMSSLYQAADYVLCDAGGPVYSALYLSKDMILLNRSEKDNRGIYKADINAAIANFDYETVTGTELKSLLTDEHRWKEQREMQRLLREKIFGSPEDRSGSLAAAQKLRELLRS